MQHAFFHSIIKIIFHNITRIVFWGFFNGILHPVKTFFTYIEAVSVQEWWRKLKCAWRKPLTFIKRVDKISHAKNCCEYDSNLGIGRHCDL